MIFRSIRARILLSALLPVSLAILVLVGFFWSSRLEDASQFYSQRAKLLLRQVAMSSEFGLFSGNMANLQAIVNSVQHEPDVYGLSLFDATGALLVSAGPVAWRKFADATNPDNVAQQYKMGVDTIFEPIASSRVEISDLFTGSRTEEARQSLSLGYVVLEMSREGLLAREHELMWLSLWVGTLSLLFAGALAARLSDAVVRPILRVLGTIERVGQGNFAERTQVEHNDLLYDVQQGLNQMARRLAWGRDELEQRVQEVTRELNIKKEEAEAATQAKSRFLAAASHDLRQPTHALGLFIARLGQLPLEGISRQLVGQIEASTLAMQELLDSLLDISRLDAGVVPVHVSVFRVQTLLESVEGALAPLAEARGLRLRVRPTELWTRTDAALLKRMVMNLMHNALRYTEQGTVLLACRPMPRGNRVRIEVWDSGVGISSEHQANIFKEFFQVGNQARQRSQGLGLGLNIVERSAQLLGVEVGLRSAPGCGSRFSISLPAAVAEPAALALPVEVASSDLDGVTVLVVEDDAYARLAMADLLTSWGCIVVVACDAAQAVTAIENGLVPEVVVSDYRLGEGENGIQVISRARTLLGHSVPACLMSGSTDPALMQSTQAVGLTLLHKPIRPAKLRSLMRRLISRSGASAQPKPASGRRLA